jgi:hypothetical protein
LVLVGFVGHEQDPHHRSVYDVERSEIIEPWETSSDSARMTGQPRRGTSTQARPELPDLLDSHLRDERVRRRATW